MKNEELRELYDEFLNSPDSEDRDESLNSRVLLVDGLNTFFRNFCVNPSLDSDGEHIGGLVGFLKSVGYAIRLHNATRCIIVFDGKDSSKSRRKKFSGYKETRSLNKLNVNRAYETTDDEEQMSIRNQLVLLAKILEDLPVTVLMYDGVEADDVIAYICNELVDGLSIIMSSDKDFLQLVSENTVVWSPTKKKLYDMEAVHSEFGIYYENFIIYRSLIGDPSDNIPGIKGFGLKTVKKRFPFLSEHKKIDASHVLEYAKDQGNSYKVYSNLLEHEDEFMLNFEIMQLSDSNINPLTRLKINDKFNEKIPEYMGFKLFSDIVKYKLTDAFSNIQAWGSTTFSKLSYYATRD